MTTYIDSDLSEEATDAYFKDSAPNLAEIIKNMESFETWTQDRHEEVQVIFQRLAEKIEQADFLNGRNVNGEIIRKLVVLLGYISSGKAIKLLMWIEQAMPDFVARTLAEAQMLGHMEKINEQAAFLYVERFYVLERLDLLSRIFSEERVFIIQQVLRILSGEDEYDENDEEF